jgi:hypothetical protein
MKVGRTRIALAVSLAVAIASLAVGGPSALGTKHLKPIRVAATATLAHNDATGDFTGTLSSSNSICISKRPIDLWSFGASSSNSPTLLGTTKTTSSGQFTFHEPTAQAGFYGLSYPLVPRYRGHKKEKEKFICLAGAFHAVSF